MEVKRVLTVNLIVSSLDTAFFLDSALGDGVTVEEVEEVDEASRGSSPSLGGTASALSVSSADDELPAPKKPFSLPGHWDRYRS